MEAIILGSPYDVAQGSVTPIIVPAYTADQAVIVLSDVYSPYLLPSGSSSDSFWFRNNLGYVYPLTITDKVIVGGTSIIGSEQFRVVGKVLVDSIQLGNSTTISSILNDGTLSANSQIAIPTQFAVKTYVDTLSATTLHAGNNISLLTNDAGYIITEIDPIFVASTAFNITSTQVGNWNTAYGWGNHALIGYLTSETDPVFLASDASAVTAAKISNWDTAFSWGNYALAGYLTVETDPVFVASIAHGIIGTDITNWNTAFSDAHVHNNFALLQTIINSGDGLKALYNDGTYKSTAIVAGSDTYVQFNNAGVLGADSTFNFDSVNKRVNATQTLVTTSYYSNTTTNIHKDGSNNLTFVDAVSGTVTLASLVASTGTIFSSPTGYTTTSATVGGIASGTAVASLNGKTLLQVMQMMLFPTPLAPSFVNPTESIALTIGTPANFSGTFVEKGTSSTMTIVGTLNTSNGPGGNVYALVNGSPSYQLNGSGFTNGSSVTFTSTSYIFEVDQVFKANGLGETTPEFVTLPDSTVVYANSYLGYSPGTVIATKTYVVVDPTYYGAFIAGTSTYSTMPTFAEIKAGCTKLIGPEPTTLSVPITSYTGSTDTHKYIVIAYPDSYGLLTHIFYVEGGNNDVISSFLNTTATYTRADSTTVTYRVYYALNSYSGVSTPGTLHYTINF
jgi:hypothetical protein